MKQYFLPFLAVIIGVLLVLIFKHKKSNYTKFLLSFSGAFLLALTLFDLLPEVYEHLDAKQTGLFIMLGILLQILLEFFSKGAEHGHVHVHKHETGFPWVLFISLCIHSFLEGFPIHQHNDMVYGVLIHKIPIAALITTYLVESKFTLRQIVGFLVIFALMTPTGTLVSNTVPFVGDYLFFINAIVIGIFFHISTVILFESNENHRFNLTKLILIALGILVAYLI
ncbi:ZIP family metal transporter [Gelidibacter japonicus]|jgi:zinc transporter ZupT|uniref:ZIP family metal transporter n=1 Tax=Gelidibacter japonicus TaxID=1962232 RepID=UPI0013D7CD30|nr:ZIP family metal transporter [Gelidibacter japonicus]MCL8007512.1 ZIP family metal transporter [Gelidibacter japonicus]